METIISDFGVKPVYLAAQVVNFLILFIILKKLLYKPVLKVLEERKKTVSDNLAKAEQISLQLQTTKQESEKKLSETSKQAQLILDNASTTANRIIADAHDKAQADVELIIKEGKQSISDEREMMKKQTLEELGGLVILGVERIAGKVLDQPDHTKIVDQTINRLKGDISD